MADRPGQRYSTTPQQSIDDNDSSNAARARLDDLMNNDYSLESFPVADGYQPPSRSRATDSSSSSPPRTYSRRSVALQTYPSSSFPDPPKKKQPQRDNTSGLAPRNSFSLRHDAQYSDLPRRMASVASTSSMTEPSPSKLYSTTSRLPIPRPTSTFVGASAPSHPYGMYPQNTSLTRQSTISTAFHHSPSRSLSGSHRPIHPYAMYTQSTEDNIETDPLHSSGDIASVGFPGSEHQYTRRLGPEGEEADDIIGADGHTEQLPPYTRYPNGRDASPIPPKQRITSVLPPESRISHISLQTPQTANSATPMTDPLLINRAPFDGAMDPLVDGGNTQDPSTREKLASRSKRRTCFGHLPVWAVALMLALLVVVAAVLGAIIGHLVSHASHGDPLPTVTSIPDSIGHVSVTMITTIIHDAAPLQTTASNIPPAPTGSFSLVMGAPSESSDSCLEFDQGFAWQCAPGALLNIDVSNPMWDAAQITLSSNNDSMDYGGPSYGAASPSFNGSASATLMNDTNDPQLGPALFFYQTFDKVVVLPTNAPLNSSAPTRRSALLDLAERDSPHGLQEGDQAWVCYWNGTKLEGFIYVEQYTAANANNSAIASSIATTDVSQPTPSATSNEKRREHHHHHDFFDENSKSGSGPSNMPALYPRIVKLEERRDPETALPPYCQVMQVQADNSFIPVPGNASVIELLENDTNGDNESVASVPSKRSLGTRGLSLQVRQNGPNFCHCEWLSQ